jgi:hypothetical protein
MSDDELRALERRVINEGTADDLLRLAGALERLGRRDEAATALLPIRDHPEARSRVAAHSCCWEHRTNSSRDVPLLMERPPVLWSCAPKGCNTRLRATLLGAAFDHDTESDGQWTQVLDIVSGASRLQLPPDLEECVGDVAVCSSPDGISAFDIWTGEELWSAGIRASWRATREGVIAWLGSDVVVLLGIHRNRTVFALGR